MDAEETRRLDRKHIIHSWSVNAALDPTVITDAQGVYLTDHNGRRLLDFTSQLKVVTVGFKNEKIINALKTQAEKMGYINPGVAYETRSLLGKTLAQVTPGRLDKFFFTLAGADANENAVKMARAYTKKHKVLAYYRSYHGATYGAITLSGDPRRPLVEPGIPGVVHILNPYCYRCPFGLVHPGCDLHCAEHVAEVIQYELADTIAALIIEPVVGAGGVIIPPDGYMQRLKEICAQNEILLIADEIMTGLGRTGRWFGVQHWDVVPDLLTMAKGLTSGYLPMGAIAVSPKVSAALDKEMLYCGLTYSGHPMGCAAAVATIEVLKAERLVENSANLGAILKSELERMRDRHPCIGDVRCLGLFACIELVKDRKTKEPLVPYNAMGSKGALSKEIAKRLAAKGVFAAVRWMLLSISPPLSITEDQLREGLAAVDEVLEFVDSLVNQS